MEGGLGDHLLANRFAAAIREKYPNDHITLYSDTEGNHSSSKILMELFPRFYNESQVVPNRKNKEFLIKVPFGSENYPAHLDNLPEEFSEKFKNADKFYDLHIDGLKWLKADFDWLRYYYHFPKPQIELVKHKHFSGDYILCHLFSRPDSPYNLEKSYAINLVQKLSEFTNVVIITTEEHLEFYKEVLGLTNVFVATPNLKDCFSLASECKAFVGIDSGIRYIPYHFSKPVFVFSKYCSQYRAVAPSHLIRWLIFEKNVLPMNANLEILANIFKTCINNPASVLFPEAQQEINKYIIDREL